MTMQCYSVKCVSADGTEYEVGVMTSDEKAAMRCAENSLREGRHISAKAVSVRETNAI